LTHGVVAAYYSFIDPEGTRGCVGLVGWPIADGLPTWVVTHRLQVERRTGKFDGVKTDVLPLSYAALYSDGIEYTKAHDTRNLANANRSNTISLIFRHNSSLTRMWVNAQRDGRPAEYRWRPLFNAAKLGW